MRRAAALLAAVAAGSLALFALDDAVRAVVVDADGWLDRPFFRDFGPFQAEGYRIASPRSELLLVGLWPDASVDVGAAVASALPKGQEVEVTANGSVAHRSDVGGQYGVLRFTARTDGSGRLALRFLAPRARAPEALRVSWVRVQRGPDGRRPWRRLPLFAAALALAGLGALWATGKPRAASISVAVVVLAIAAALAAARVLAAYWLPRAVACAAASLLLAVACAAGLRLSRTSAAWWGAVLAFRIFLLPLPDLGSIDLTFHAHNIERFQRGEVLGSAVSDATGQPVFIPYPPALYAALAPFVPVGDTARGEAVVRWAMIALEASVPLLVLLIMRATGANERASALAVVAASAMPEGLLMVPKGIAANVAGSWLGLLAIWSVVARASPVIVAGAMALAYLGHPGSAASLAGLVVVWAVLAARSGAATRGRAVAVVAAAAGGALVAWALYYREVAGLTRDSLGYWRGEAGRVPSSFFRVRWVHLGKMAQDVALKFGLGPFALAVAGLVGDLPPRLRALLQAWILVAGGLAAFAVLTPFALRFEYFVGPAVAMAAGVGADRACERGRAGLVTAAWSLAFALQVAVALWLHSGRLDPINLIIPSPRWPLVR
ncbi:MAG TPA: hypothetical protein VFQ51_19320 [Vicinamibacteria bacterium]|nr:hypothetical protein [Vicinamibacteria bacterium]